MVCIYIGTRSSTRVEASTFFGRVSPRRAASIFEIRPRSKPQRRTHAVLHGEGKVQQPVYGERERPRERMYVYTMIVARRDAAPVAVSSLGASARWPFVVVTKDLILMINLRVRADTLLAGSRFAGKIDPCDETIGRTIIVFPYIHPADGEIDDKLCGPDETLRARRNSHLNAHKRVTCYINWKTWASRFRARRRILLSADKIFRKSDKHRFSIL